MSLPPPADAPAPVLKDSVTPMDIKKSEENQKNEEDDKNEEGEKNGEEEHMEEGTRSHDRLGFESGSVTPVGAA